MRLQAENFQSWSQVSLDIEGFTTIVGPSDLGKSAIFRMARGVFRNDIGANKIKNGETELQVSVSFDKENIVAKRTVKGATTYTVNGAEYGKLAGNVPEPVVAYGYGPIQIGNVELDPIFGGQFDSQFLLSSSPSDLNTVLGAFSSTEKLDQGKKRIGIKIKELDTEAKVLASMISEAEAKAHNAKSFLDQALIINDDVSRMDEETQFLGASIQKIDKLIGIEDKQTVLKSYYDAISEYTVSTDDVKAYAKLIDVIQEYRVARYVVNVASASKAAIESISVAEIREASNQISLISKYLAMNKTVPDVSLLKIEDLVSHLHAVEDRNYEIILLELYERLTSLVDDYRGQLADMEEEANDILAELEELRMMLRLENASKTECPKCGFLFKVE